MQIKIISIASIDRWRQAFKANLFDGKIDVVPGDYRVDKIFLSANPFILKSLASLP
jgi:hypothetical protein